MEDENDDMLFFDNPHPNPAKAIYSLHRLQDPDALQAARARFDKTPSPGPSSSPSSASSQRTVMGADFFHHRESTADIEYREAREARERLFKSTPQDQFRLQVDLESERILEQSSDTPQDKEYLLPYDHNIRAEWIKRGIWAKEWIPTRHEPEGFLFGILWGHERPVSSSHPKSAPKLENGKEDGKGKAQPQPGLQLPSSELKLTENSQPIPEALEDLYVEGFRKLTVRNIDASRPLNQFNAQVRREKAWLKFKNDNLFRRELRWHQLRDDDTPKPKRPKVSLHEFKQSATQAVIDRWKNWGIWNAAWTDEQQPGEAWAHEAYVAEKLPTILAAEARAQEETSDTKGTNALSTPKANGKKRQRDHEADDDDDIEPSAKKIWSNKTNGGNMTDRDLPRRSARIAKQYKPIFTGPLW